MSLPDLERGLPATDEGAGRGSRAENPEFMRLTEQVGLHIFRINANVATLQKLDSQLRRNSNESLRRQL